MFGREKGLLNGMTMIWDVTPAGWAEPRSPSRWARYQPAPRCGPGPGRRRGRRWSPTGWPLTPRAGRRTRTFPGKR
ncbi:hypothetical protein AB0M54_14175 [Actinoplanes sp. NPDC051470]|uniref:hypothetical protein n=1 Tax=unclassified Actinoplanes TaxID=2626549 RepID=UPI003437FE84